MDMLPITPRQRRGQIVLAAQPPETRMEKFCGNNAFVEEK